MSKAFDETSKTTKVTDSTAEVPNWQKAAWAVNIFLWGPPGVGKTMTIKHFARQQNAILYEKILSHYEPPDFGGMRRIEGGQLIERALPWLTELAEIPPDRPVILLLDEFTTASPALQAPALKLVHERKVGEVRLGENIAIILAGNPPDQAAGGFDLEPPMKNRLVHYQFEVNVGDWVANFPDYWGAPPTVFRLKENDWRRARRLVAEYIAINPHLLFVAPQSDEELAWPTPRSWESVSRLMAVLGDDLTVADVAGAIGEGYAADLMNWLSSRKSISFRELLVNPSLLATMTSPAVYRALSALLTVIPEEPDLWLPAWDLFVYVGENLPELADVIAPALKQAIEMIGKNSLPFPTQQAGKLRPIIKALKGEK